MLRHSKVSLLEKQNVIKYLELLNSNADAANILTNGFIVLVLLKMLRHSKVRESEKVFHGCFGRIIVYISTQNEHARDNKPMESDSRPSSCWQVPSPIISLVSSLLRNREEDITQLYAPRTIENIFSQGRALGKQEIMRSAAGSCVARLVRFNPYSTNHGKTFIQGYGFKLGQECNLREQSA